MDGADRNDAGLHQALDVWRRRRRLGALVVLGAAVPALSFVVSLPDIYRASTTVINASIRPVVGRYLENIEARLRESGLAIGLTAPARPRRQLSNELSRRARSTPSRRPGTSSSVPPALPSAGRTLRVCG